MKQKILVTGVAGFIGFHLVSKITSMGHIVIGIDDLSGGYTENIHNKVKFYKFNYLVSANHWWRRTCCLP